MNRTDLVDCVIGTLQEIHPEAHRAVVQKLIKESVLIALDCMSEQLASGMDLRLRSFGSFTVHWDRGRVARVPTGKDGLSFEEVQIPPTRRVRFRPSRRITNALKEGAMEKLGVDVNKKPGDMTKTADKGTDKCGCGRELEKTANVSKCPVHGTAPFEKRESER